SIPRASRSTTKFLDDLVTKLETGESPNEPEKRLIAKACAPPLERHSLHRGLTWRREARRYLTHLFKPYPQLQIPDFVSNSGDAEDPGFMMSRLRLDYRQNDLKRRDLLLNLIKN
uniref:PORR domain-containing protein n=2 Tax=Bursaphelenchus xylophilus TaxID=6326 RepID=A0A1I7S1D4_BURXY